MIVLNSQTTIKEYEIWLKKSVPRFRGFLDNSMYLESRNLRVSCNDTYNLPVSLLFMVNSRNYLYRLIDLKINTFVNHVQGS